MVTLYIVIGVAVGIILIHTLFLSKPLKYLNLGIKMYNQTHYEAAIEFFNKSIEINSLNGKPYLLRAYAKHKIGFYQEAIDDYTLALRKMKADADLYINRGSLKHLLQDYKGAIDDYDNALKIKPSDGDAYYNRALSKSQLGQNEEAYLDLRLASNYGNEMANSTLNEIK